MAEEKPKNIKKCDWCRKEFDDKDNNREICEECQYGSTQRQTIESLKNQIK